METISKFNATVEVDLENQEILEESNGSFKTSVALSEEYLDALEDEYNAYAAECKAGMEKALLQIKILSEAFIRNGKRNPFCRIDSRIKTWKSVRGKCRTRGYELSSESIKEHIKDVAGIRIITNYLDETNLVKNLITQIPEISVVTVKDYINSPKENGYKSIHLGCQIGIYDPFDGLRMRPLEIQIRTNIMDLWSGFDHDINYKKTVKLESATEKFRDIAQIFEQLEGEMTTIRDECEGATSAGPDSTSEQLAPLKF